MIPVLNVILSKLPGNGSKTLLGIVMYAAGVLLPQYFPEFPVPALQTLLEYFGFAYGGLGLFHKAVKVTDK